MVEKTAYQRRKHLDNAHPSSSDRYKSGELDCLRCRCKCHRSRHLVTGNKRLSCFCLDRVLPPHRHLRWANNRLLCRSSHLVIASVGWEWFLDRISIVASGLRGKLPGPGMSHLISPADGGQACGPVRCRVDREWKCVSEVTGRVRVKRWPLSHSGFENSQFSQCQGWQRDKAGPSALHLW